MKTPCFHNRIQVQALVVACAFLACQARASLPDSKADREFFYRSEEELIPKSPSAPPALIQKKPPVIPHCERYVMYDGRKIECDSQLGHDVVNLKVIVKDVPAAVAELDAYQRTHQNLRYVAYAGSLGLGSMILGISMNRPIADPGTGHLRPGGYFVIGGLLLLVGAVTYGFIASNANEDRVPRAIDLYNEAQKGGAAPAKLIEPQFTHTFHF